LPSRERVEQLIAQVERGELVSAIEEFYTEEASMQENQQRPRWGRKRLIARERGILIAYKSVRALPGTFYLVDGDRAAIHWVLEFTWRDGHRFTQDEIAYQRWVGDRIDEERFYYDPAQRRLGGVLRVRQMISEFLFELRGRSPRQRGSLPR